ncbi:hypothetical protein DGWBC_1689 [Dehalogenimonas sp. WBC-2]|nr:hypothetical protein DGWBC_1689 [Dehalogenimonas sp. WBC-2]
MRDLTCTRGIKQKLKSTNLYLKLVVNSHMITEATRIDIPKPIPIKIRSAIFSFVLDG